MPRHHRPPLLSLCVKCGDPINPKTRACDCGSRTAYRTRQGGDVAQEVDIFLGLGLPGVSYGGRQVARAARHGRETD